MPSVREIMLNRAKAPAKIHAMDRQPVPADLAAAVSPLGSPHPRAASPLRGGQDANPGTESPAAARPPVASRPPVQTPPSQGGGAAASTAAARPPRPAARATPGSSGSTGSTGSSALKKMSESRRPRPGSEPGRRRAPSEPPAGAAEASAARGEDRAVVGEPGQSQGGAGPRPRGKARASSVGPRGGGGAGPRGRAGDNTPPASDKRKLGEVPAYLRRYQEEVAEEKRRAARPPSPQPPPGFRKVDEEEKTATLRTLNVRKVEAEKAQRALPFKIETLGQKQREKEIQDRIAHLDKLIGMFSKPVVFVPADAEPISESVPPLGAAAPEPGGAVAPWERNSPSGYSGRSGGRSIRTGVQVQAPPGGVSSLQIA